jgi:hypothetical protein
MGRAMTVEQLKATLSDEAPPPGVPATVEALWQDARGDWDRAHRIAQDIDDAEGAWVHAYLHRKEGDLSNASYWYRRAGRDRSTASLEEEWEQIAGQLLP